MGTANETRDGKPWNGTFETFDDAGDLWFRERYQDGVLHGENDEPAAEHFIDGAISRRFWSRDGKPYREGGKPDFEMYHYGGSSIHLQGRTLDDGISYIDTLDERGNTIQRQWQRKRWTVGDPSVERFYSHGALMSRHYGRDYGNPRGQGLPDTETFHPNGRVEQLEWIRPEDGQPNKIRFDESGRIESAEKGFEPFHIGPHQDLLMTTQADLLRQPELPSEGLAIERDGQPWCGVFHQTTDSSTMESHYQRGALDRADGPAFIERDLATGETTWEKWLKNGERHREGGPAAIERQNDGSTTEKWYINGEEYHPTAHQRMKWAALAAQQGSPFWQPPEPDTAEIHRPGGVKAAAEAARAKPKTTASTPEQGEQR